MIRRSASALLLVCALTLSPRPLRADSQQDWFRTGTGIGVEKIRLALPAFTAENTEAETPTGVFNAVLWYDLEASGILELVSPSFYPLETPTRPENLKHDAWMEAPVNAHMVAFGSLRTAEKELLVDAWLADVRNPRAPPVIAKRYRGQPTEEDARQIAHQFADEIIQALSGGQPGIASTRIAFVSARTGSKEIWMMDYDGHNQRQLTRCGSLCLTPRWSPDNTLIAYTAYESSAGNGGVPRTEIHLHSTIMNRRIAFPHFRGTTTTPAFSPDSSQIAFSSSITGDQEIYLVGRDGGRQRRLTMSRGVDISPAWNPRTGNQIAFVSDRGGSPQIYLMNADGTNVERITSGEGYAVSPSWSPNGQLVAFAWQRQGSNFDIYVMDVATRQWVQLTQDSGRNESPSWAPDGRHLVFESTRTGRSQIWMMLADGSGLRQLTFEGLNTAPQWSR